MRLNDADALYKKLVEEIHNRSMQGFGKGLMIANSCVINAPTIEPDTDTISRQAVLDGKIVAVISDQTIEVVPVSYIDNIPPTPSRPKGQWEMVSQHGNPPTYIYSCSECQHKSFGFYNYCPNCGRICNNQKRVMYERFIRNVDYLPRLPIL